MRYLFSFLLTLSMFFLQAQTREYRFPVVNWAVSIPTDMEIVDSATVAQAMEVGRQVLQYAYDTSFDISRTQTLINARKGMHNTFSASITPYNEALNGDWKKGNDEMKTILVETFQTQIPGLRVDTSSTIEVIGDRVLSKFSMKLFYPRSIVLHFTIYSALINGYDFGMSITYLDEAVGRRFFELARNSMFR